MLWRWSLSLLALLSLAGVSRLMAESEDRTIVAFRGEHTRDWRVVNDGVMGGLSQSRIEATPDGAGMFAGRLSLENNGGFASVRADVGPLDLSPFDGLAVRVRGDGRQYRLRLRTDERFDGVAYQATFDTEDGGWQTIEIPFSTFAPTYRGRTLTDVPPLDPGRIRQLGFMIAEKQAGEFQLVIEWVRVYGPRARTDPAQD